jgi:hypothetical protein
MEDEKAAAEMTRRALVRARDAARKENTSSFMFLEGFDPDSNEGRAVISSLATDLAQARAMSDGSTDPWYYVVPLSTPSGVLIPNRLFRNTLPLGGNIKFVFLSDAVRYSSAEDPGVKQVTVQVFFVADIAGRRYILSPTYQKSSRIIVPQVTAFNCLFTDKKGALLMKSLLDPYPPAVVGFECLAQMYGGMLNTYGAGDKIKFLKRAHQAFDLIEERIPGGERAWFAGIMKKYLANSDFTDVARLYEAPAVARGYVERGVATAALDDGFDGQFRLLGDSLKRLAAAFPRVRGALVRYANNNDAIIRLWKSRGAAGEGELVNRLEESVRTGRAIERLLIEDADMDVLLREIGRTLADGGVSQSVTLVPGGAIPFTPAIKLKER